MIFPGSVIDLVAPVIFPQGVVGCIENPVAVDEDAAGILLKLLDALDDNDDVQRVAANFDVADDVLERLSA